MKFQKTIQITNTAQLIAHPPQRGQWIKLEWCDKPSRFHHVISETQYVRAFHYPHATGNFNQFCRLSKAYDAFVAFNRHARELSR